jgi:methylated-DNA-[protein]-cysteine S-methyltransferase
MEPLSFNLFDTSIGWCGVIGVEDRIYGSALPERNPDLLRARLSCLYPGASETATLSVFERVIIRIRNLIDGENDDLLDVDLDMSAVSTFERAVFEITRKVRPGETTTYGEIARALGDINESRAVGRALGRNRYAPIVPCHRVVAAGQKLGGFSASGGRSLKLRMLATESRLASDDLFGGQVLRPIPGALAK